MGGEKSRGTNVSRSSQHRQSVTRFCEMNPRFSTDAPVHARAAARQDARSPTQLRNPPYSEAGRRCLLCVISAWRGVCGSDHDAGVDVVIEDAHGEKQSEVDEGRTAQEAKTAEAQHGTQDQ